MKQLRIRDARTHNLKGIDLDLPHDRFVVITGPSGSGKSSLAIDTLFAEGQRQYLESLSLRGRQFIGSLPEADVESIEGLRPTICLDQKAVSPGPRSTVGTVSEIHDFLRLLFARAGRVHCYRCGKPIQQQTVQQICQTIEQLPESTKVMVLAPLVSGRSGRHAEVFEQIRKERLVRVRVDGEIWDLDQVPDLEPGREHSIEAITDRIIVRPEIHERLYESVDLAVKMTGGKVGICYLIRTSDSPDSAWEVRWFSTRYACPTCEISYQEIQPRTFSYNSPYGACPACQGLGVDTESASVIDSNATRKNATRKRARPNQKRQPSGIEDEATEGMARHVQLPCPECGGSRLNSIARSVTLAGATIAELSDLPIDQCWQFFRNLDQESEPESVIGSLAGDVARRLAFLDRVGLGYLTLSRSAQTLSGGELQRVRLATAIGSGLSNICYVLDEPSVGLHPQDNDRLIGALRDLQQRGNSLIVVEHDEAIIRAADWVIDVGPAAGEAGGRIMAQGTPEQIAQTPGSVTGDYLAGRRQLPVPETRRPIDPNRMLILRGATGNNLQDVELKLPLGLFVCVTGVSGSGKSTLINGTLAPAIQHRLGAPTARAHPYRSIEGADSIGRIVSIDQRPIGRSPRGCAATYTGIFDEFRKIFAATRTARQLGFGLSRFSFNSKAGRCPICKGNGRQRLEMCFLPDLYVTCDACRGDRFNRQTLQVRFAGWTIADVLAMSVDQALQAFDSFQRIHQVLASLEAIGLGYLRLGQPATTLSGGEAQRVKLATHLAKRSNESTLFVLDEPTTGLHFDDVRRLLEALNRLVDQGNSIVVIEHHPSVVRAADWVIGLGPAGGRAGGRIVATGPPDCVKMAKTAKDGKKGKRNTTGSHSSE